MGRRGKSGNRSTAGRKTGKSARRQRKEIAAVSSNDGDPVDGQQPDVPETNLGYDDDSAPDEVPIGKSEVDFIPLVSKKRKRGKSGKQPANESKKLDIVEPSDQDNEHITKKPKEDGQFFERFPGHYFGSQKTSKFRVVDLSSNAHMMSSAHKRAIALKNGMFSRHRRISGAQLTDLHHKSKMVGKW